MHLIMTITYWIHFIMTITLYYCKVEVYFVVPRLRFIRRFAIIGRNSKFIEDEGNQQGRTDCQRSISRQRKGSEKA